ncbi:hypothetical protein VNI00_016825 [Paramarasmius palmivorus]|uniref:Uncharacterized protein n=1 Tax=Paramarasmius palmivorus TaxID=297713 RepID=A0AAW0BB15_9AGAR
MSDDYTLQTLRRIDLRHEDCRAWHWGYDAHDMYWDEGQSDPHQQDVLALPMGLSTNKKLLVLDQYQYWYDRIEAIRTSSVAGVVVLGNPCAGALPIHRHPYTYLKSSTRIGKDAFLHFFYLQKLLVAQPVIYYKNGNMAIHWKDKCFATDIRRIPISFFDTKKFEGVVALIEVSGDEELPAALISKTVSLFQYKFQYRILLATKRGSNSEKPCSW